MNHFHTQFKRENDGRLRRGLEPYADVTAYLVAQGYTEAEARARAGNTAGATIEASSEVPPDAAEIYATANKLHRKAIYGADAPADNDTAPTDSMQTSLRHASQPEGAGAEDIAAEQRAFEHLAGDVYRGAVNELYRKAISGSSAPAQ